VGPVLGLMKRPLLYSYSKTITDFLFIGFIYLPQKGAAPDVLR